MIYDGTRAESVNILSGFFIYKRVDSLAEYISLNDISRKDWVFMEI